MNELAHIGRGPRPRAGGARAAVAALALVVPLTAAGAAPDRVFRETRHGSRESGVLRVPGYGRGECVHCHGGRRDATERAARGGRGHAGLFARTGNDLCVECHRSAAGKWLGEGQYAGSAHGWSPLAVWPGPEPKARPPADAGRCVNCHDPHGVKDGAGLVPSLLRKRGAALCLGCHAGNPATDVASAFASAYRHPLVDVAAPAGPAPTQTCGACHNAHAAASRQASPGAGEASGALLGVSRVRVSNGRAGSPPVLEPVAARELQAPREHEVCFRCHASTAPAPARGADVAAELNPANASYHPVQDRIRGARLEPRSFTFEWRSRRTVTCSDCHSPDDGIGRGPHGSRYEHILKKRHLPPGAAQPTLETDLCLDCHEYATYADPLRAAGAAFSRFPFHLSHAAHGAACSACHDGHGSATLPALLVLRPAGLAGFEPRADGGSCTASCHRTSSSRATYFVTYPR